MTKIALICHLERLFPYDDGALAYFAMNMSVVVEGKAVADDLKYLKPWDWKIKEVRAATFTESTIPTVMTATIVPPPDMPADKLGELKKVLEKQIGTFDSARFSWIPDATGLEPRNLSEKPWQSFLGHLSTFPPPVPQALNLSMIFTVPAATVAGKQIVAAAAFDAASPFGEIAPLTPDGKVGDVNTKNLHLVKIGPTDQDKRPFFYVWNYETKAVEFAAYERECFADEKPDMTGQFLDVTTGWVTDPMQPPAVLTEDWTAYLEIRLSRSFDLTQRILDVARTRLHDLPFWDARIDLWKVLVASLRDLAGIGVTPLKEIKAGPDRLSLPGAVILALGAAGGSAKILDRLHVKTLPEALDLLENLLRSSQETKFPDVSHWAVFLQANLPSTAQVLEMLNVPQGDTDPHPINVSIDRVNEIVERFDQIREDLAQPQTLAQVVWLQWKDALSTNAADFWNEFADAILRLFQNEIQLQSRLALCNLGIAWSRLGSGFHTDDQLKSEVQKALGEYYRGRFQLANDAAYRAYRPPAAETNTKRADAIAGGINAFAADILRRLKPDGLDLRNVSEGLSFQVNRLDRDQPETGTKEEQSDLLRRIAGIGLLLKADLGPWQCLHLANFLVGPSSMAGPQEDPGGISILENAVVPSKLGYRNDVSHSFIVYDNAPITAENPLSRISRRVFDEATRDADTDAHPWFRYANPYGKDNPLPALRFARKYKAFGFIVGIGGNLPLEIADGTLRRIDAEKLKNFQHPQSVTILPWETEYLRNVGIGRLRVSPENESLAADNRPFEFADLNFPPIPDTVYPLARSKTQAKEENGFPSAEPPVVLLHSSDEAQDWIPDAKVRFTFHVRPPNIDLQTWERWTDMPAAEKIDVFASYFQSADNARDNEALDELSPNDPAVLFYAFQLELIAGSQTPAPDPDPQPVPRITDATGLKRVHHPKFRVTLQCVPSGGSPASRPQIVVETDGVTVNIPKGHVCKLTISSAIRNDDLKRFSSAVKNSNSGTVGGFTLFSPLELYIEGGTSQMPEPKRLHDALDLNDATNPGALTITLQPMLQSEFVRRVEFLVQQWGWRGRPVEEFPDNEDARKIWDAIGFADRDSDDHLKIPAAGDYAAPSPQLPTVLRKVAAGHGAIYYRVAVRAWSRYEGLLRGPSVDSRRGDADDPSEQWKRHLLPAALTQTVRPPAVKLILPLLRNPGKGPALLVVLSEPWFDVAGLAEQLAVRIADAALPENGTPIPEFGPDPILDVAPIQSDVRVDTVEGPFGYTFDTDAAAPLFGNSGFLISAPDLRAKDAGYYFIKLQFQRRLIPNLTASGKEITSAWTQPVWAQFLPDSSTFMVERNQRPIGPLYVSRDLKLGYDATKQKFFLWYRDPKAANVAEQEANVVIKPRVAPERAEVFQIRIILMRSVTDFLGREDQEVYTGLFEQDKDGYISSPAISDMQRYKAYVAEFFGASELDPDPFKQILPSDPANPGQSRNNVAFRLERVIDEPIVFENPSRLK